MKRDLNFYIRAFQSLRRDHKMGGAPHKPVLLLSILDVYEYQSITDNRIFITPELISFFKANWAAFVTTEHEPRFALPFYHMGSEPFWKLIPNDGCEIWVESKSAMRGIGNLVRAVSYAMIDAELTDLLKNTPSRNILRTILIEHYFPHARVLSAGRNGLKMIEVIEAGMVGEPSIPDYQVPLSEEEQEEIVIRGGLFKRMIPRIYRYTCCISGMNISTGFSSTTLIEACHIKKFTECYDDSLTNGLALCPTLHKAFDAGILSISEDFRVIVSKRIKERKSAQSIAQFEGRMISLPENIHHFPHHKNLKWHLENVFERSR